MDTFAPVALENWCFEGGKEHGSGERRNKKGSLERENF
jgi:hypothetical protein